jgi:hypothetical protein
VKGLEGARRTGEGRLVGSAMVGRAAAFFDEGRTAEALALAPEAPDLDQLILKRGGRRAAAAGARVLARGRRDALRARGRGAARSLRVTEGARR